MSGTLKVGGVNLATHTGTDGTGNPVLDTAVFPAGHVIWVNSVHKNDVASIDEAVSGTIEDIPSMTLTTPVPASGSSKYLITANLAYGMEGDVNHVYTFLHRAISGGGASGRIANAASADSRQSAWGVSNAMVTGEMRYTALTYLDAPGSSVAITYKLQWINGNTNVTYLNRSFRDTNGTASDGRATSSFTIMEIAG